MVKLAIILCADRVIPEKAGHPEPPFCTINSGAITGDSMKSYKSIIIDGKQVRLHRALMEAYIGRKLMSWELVHHRDGNIHNNELSNLSIVTNSIHAKIHHFGESAQSKKTQFKKKYNIDQEQLRYLYEDCGYTIQAIADKMNVYFGVIWRRIKEYKIRENMKCVECGREIESYIRARQCNRCYHRAYRVKQTRI